MELTKDMIDNPSLWRLSLEVDKEKVEVAINTPIEDHALIYRTLALDASMSTLSAFEDAIYDNPLLLADFKKVDVLVDTPRFTIVPSEITDEEVREEIIRAVWPDPGYVVVANSLPTGDTLLCAVEEGMAAFVHRTFLDSEILHPMSVLVRYFSRISGLGNTSKLYCRLRKGYVDVIGFSKGKLCVATSIEADSIADIVYYILATAQTAGMNLDNDEIFIYGNSAQRDAAMEKLRDFARYVMPVIFPSQLFKSGKDALKVPFELIILPLCE